MAARRTVQALSKCTAGSPGASAHLWGLSAINSVQWPLEAENVLWFVLSHLIGVGTEALTGEGTCPSAVRRGSRGHGSTQKWLVDLAHELSARLEQKQTCRGLVSLPVDSELLGLCIPELSRRPWYPRPERRRQAADSTQALFFCSFCEHPSATTAC